MALSECVIKDGGISATLSDTYTGDAIRETYQIRLTSGERNPLVVEALANAGGTNPLPQRGTLYGPSVGYGLYARRFDWSIVDPHLIWQCVVNYEPLKPGEQDPTSNSNPLAQPPTFSLDWIEYEAVITEAYNLDGFGDGIDGYSRSIETLGPVVNSYGREFDEPLTDVRREAVLNITRNYATLDQIINIQETYAGTTNSDTFKGASARRCKFLAIESGGIQTSNGIDFYRGTSRIKVGNTTDRELLNTGWEYLDADGDVVEHEGAEPVFLTLAGRKSDEPVNVTYRHLEAVAYAPLG